eukprot:CAMPEP_0198524968 /NCGR_PEP_ID=MMETSP1462-20131121/23062_1 /TAXON_ID=1333877 /ORGANISM="Brandtodinium nutriculum, Strain RCC3387" /LENGTH=1454 /DNA_ID=CAMNT_0044254711 /DNA_START=56 /DNA_END=4420 /DNA_ORIENTATION=-
MAGAAAGDSKPGVRKRTDLRVPDQPWGTSSPSSPSPAIVLVPPSASSSANCGAQERGQNSSPDEDGLGSHNPSKGSSRDSRSERPESNNIRVAVRIRPLNAREVSAGGPTAAAIQVCGKSVSIAKEAPNDGARGPAVTISEYLRPGRTWNFDEVYDSIDKSGTAATQEDVFEGIGVPILENALDAYNGCLFAYGQTSSGKSHSIMGDPSSGADKGVLPRACERLFDMIARKTEQLAASGTPMQTTVLASYLEIYQEKLFDLLTATRSDLQVRLHKDLGPHVPGLIQAPVASMSDVSELIDFGAKNRAVGATSMNAHSSRSHAVFTIDLHIAMAMDGGTRDLRSKVSFVDLAGSEKQKKTGATGERLQEGIAINQSLSTLSRVIQSLTGCFGKNMVVPFRDSKLTLLLKDALSGNSRTVLLACVSPAAFNLEETVSTLEFASKCKLVKTSAKQNQEDKRELIESLTAEKERIAAQLAREASMRERLQAELEKEMENARAHQIRAQNIHEEKEEIERQLGELLEAHATEKQVEEAKAKAVEQELKKRHKELEEQAEVEKQERQLKARELHAQLQEKEELEREHRCKEEQIQKLLEEKELLEAQANEKTVAEAKAKAVEQELKKRHKELEEQAEVEKQERELKARELQAQLQEKEKLEREHRCKEEQIEKLQAEKERQVSEAEADRRQALNALEESARKQAEQLQAEETKRLQAVAELQEKLEMLQARDAEQQRQAAETQSYEVELKQMVDAEIRKRKHKEESLENELQGLQSLSDSLRLEKQDLEQTAAEQKNRRERLLEELGIKGLVDDGEDAHNVPRLVNLHPDPMLQGCLVYYIAPGSTQVGADPLRCRVCLTGLDVTSEVCAIWNKDNERLQVVALPGGFVRVNGVQVTESKEGAELTTGDRLVIGRAHIFTVVIPKCPRASEDDSEEKFAKAMQELEDKAELDPKWRQVVNDAVMTVKRTHGTRQASELLDEAKGASEMVNEANALLRTVPPDWADGVSHYELAVLFKADGPPVVCVVACGPSEGQERKRRVSKGIWEASRFKQERLDYMHKASEVIASMKDEPERIPGMSFGDDGMIDAAVGSRSPKDLPPPTLDDWPSYVWSEVLLARYNELIDEKDRVVEQQELDFAVEKSRDSREKRKGADDEPWWLKLWGSRNDDDRTDNHGESGLFSVVAQVFGWPRAALDPPKTLDPAEADGRKDGRRASSRSASRMAPRKSATQLTSGTHVPRRSLTPRAPESRPSVSPSDKARNGKSPLSRQSTLGAGVVVVPAKAQSKKSEAVKIASARSSALPSTWPAAGGPREEIADKIVVPPSPPRRRESVNGGASTEVTNVAVTTLFNNRLGVRLKMDTLIVTGFDVPQAEGMGWRIGDEVFMVAGRPVRNKEDFKRELDDFKRDLGASRVALPIVFTVRRRSRGGGDMPAKGIRSSVEAVPAAAPGLFMAKGMDKE